MSVNLSQPSASIREARSKIEEIIADNPLWKSKNQQKLSVLVPTYNDDAEPLLYALGQCDSSQNIEFILYDDGGDNSHLVEKISACAADQNFPIRVISATQNLGRSGARNRLLAHARCKWVLLLDADMLPDGVDFLSNYISEIEDSPSPKLVVGGFSLKQATTDKKFALHRWQAEQSECVPADIRQSEPGRYVFTSNVLAHAELFEEIPFDETFVGWGWEDVDWGLRIAKAYPVIHLDNTATHLGLDTVQDLMRKYGGSGPNFRKAIEKHPEALQSTALFKAASKLTHLPFKPMFKSIAKWSISTSILPLPISVRGKALKLWRALVYAEALND